MLSNSAKLYPTWLESLTSVVTSTTSSTVTGEYIPVARRLCHDFSLPSPIPSMPLLLTKIEGKGNGIKTVVPNMSDVARALSRPPTYPTKYFGCELGAQTSFDEKNDRFIVNGAHDATKLRELLDGFIDRFVLCKSCKNPETDLLITKSEVIIRDCKACGERTDIDMRHKLTTFILKNPPKNAKKSKSKKAGGTDSPTNNGTHADAMSPTFDDEGDGGPEDELTKRINEAANMKTESALEKADWSVDTSAEAVRARTKAAEGAMSGLTLGDDDSDEDADSPYSQLGRWAQDNRSSATWQQVFITAEQSGIAKKHKTVQVLVENLFDEKIMEQLPPMLPLFTKVCLTPCS